ncbi:MAG: histidine phosphatase family protein [Gammaproteobacteria bacterium]
MSSKNIFLVRHGETDWNISNRYISFTDLPLNSNGKNQVSLLSKSFSNVPIDYIFTSPLQRAQMTAEIICDGLDIDINVEENLREASFGIYEGKTPEMLMNDQLSNDFKKWREGGEVAPTLELEPLAMVADRASQFLETISNIEGNILVSSHHYFIRILLAVNILGLEIKDFKKLSLSNGSCSVVQQINASNQIHLMNATRFEWDE